MKFSIVSVLTVLGASAPLAFGQQQREATSPALRYRATAKRALQATTLLGEASMSLSSSVSEELEFAVAAKSAKAGGGGPSSKAAKAAKSSKSTSVPSSQPSSAPTVYENDVPGDMEQLNAALASFNYTEVSSIKDTLETFGYTLIATPTFGAMAERLMGTTGGISLLGKFDLDEFDCPAGGLIELSAGFDSVLDGHPYMLFAGFGPNGLAGTAAQIYRDYDTEVQLKDFFYNPSDYFLRRLYAYVRNVDGSEVVDDSGSVPKKPWTETVFSDRQFPGPNGYYRTNQFSNDDGVWGFRIGSNVNGDDGPYLEDDAANSYGCENSDGNDDSFDSRAFYWGNATDTNTVEYAFYFAIKKATACVASSTSSTVVVPIVETAEEDEDDHDEVEEVDEEGEEDDTEDA